jgi:Tfp pilus assembly PilM family ATPase
MSRNRIREAILGLALQPRRLAKSLGAGLGSAPQAVTVISLDGQWLKLLQADGPPKARCITKLLACPVQGSSTEEILQLLKKAAAAEDIALADVLVANPTHLSTMRLFSLPSTDPKEIRDIVDLQAEKHTPYAKDEILTDFKVIERDKSGYSRVLLVITHQDVVHRAVRLIEAAGWTLERVGCELEGLIAWSQKAKRPASAKAPAGGSLVIDVDGATTVLLIMAKGQPQFQRSLAMGTQQLDADPAASLERLVADVQRSLEALDAEGAARIQDVLLTGPVERLGLLKTKLEEALDVPVHLTPAWQGHDLAEGLKSRLERLPEVSFASLIGLAGEPGALDLTPHTTKLRQAFEARAKSLVVLGCQAIGALILVSLLFIGRAHKEEQYYRKLRTLYEQTAPEAQLVEEALQEVVFVEEALRQQGILLKAADTMARLSPPEIEWNAITYARGESVVLHGTAEALPKIYEFTGSLAGSDVFGVVEPRRISKRKDGERDVTDFELRCPLRTAKPAP